MTNETIEPKATATVGGSPLEAVVMPDAVKEAIKLAYGHLWHIQNEPLAPKPMYSPERAAYAARHALRDMLTHEERGEAINHVQSILGA